MKIGDEVYIHGYVDEIRQNVVIIRNDGGYFGTVAEEITSRSEIPNTCGDAISRQAAKRALEDRFMELQKRHNDKRYETNYCLNTILELPSVTPQQRIGCYISAEVLDKIRAEIAEFEEEVFHRTEDYSDYAAVRYCLEIIDKYKAESEDKE